MRAMWPTCPVAFPGVAALLAPHHLALEESLLPIAPAMHYAMGGIRTELDGASTLPGLWAAGECAHTGAHGANRLASNSLLEGIVFADRAARDIAQFVTEQDGHAPPLDSVLRSDDVYDVHDADVELATMRRRMTADVGRTPHGIGTGRRRAGVRDAVRRVARRCVARA